MKMKKKLTVVLLAVLLFLVAFIPFLTDSRATLNLMTHIFLWAIFAMSYDILLGYTGIVSFGHALFFGSGAYIVGLLLKYVGASWTNTILGILASLIFGLLVALLLGSLSLRIRDAYFAMITLAFAELFLVAALKLRWITGGEDGFSFRVPELLSNRVVFYYLSLGALILTTFLLYRFTCSPAGRVLQAIRENEQRAEALGYDVFRYKLLSTAVAGVTASLAGSLFGLQMRFVSASVLSLEKTIDALLMTIIGGSGTLYGAIIGSALVNLVQDWFTGLARVYPLFERWPLLFGFVYIIIVLFFPGGLVRAFSGMTETILFKWQARRNPADNYTPGKQDDAVRVCLKRR
ncbi:branched-chain amino acid ABC transporter permease [Desulfovirgula thermocuniculi]|uniref:branched-chain amino acid ABC transporter permease n=1 Tax=Desulfovirgula thermocuniculi TaxID=348842 RepID=UPI00041526E8|nr:branched-chain amino acid ABC transporter permease [Desulfovirgula thermocuniculi]